MKLFITDQKQIAENLAQTLKMEFNTKHGYFEDKENIIIYIDPIYNIAFNGVGRKLIKFFDGMEELQVVVNYSVYNDISKLKKVIDAYSPQVINICDSSAKGQMNYELLCLCSGYNTANSMRIWLRSNIVDNETLAYTEPNKNYYSIYEAMLCETIIDLYWAMRNAELFGNDMTECNINMKEMFILNMVAIKEAQITKDSSAGSEYFRIDATIKDRIFKWSDKKKESRTRTIEEASEIVNHLRGQQLLITKVDTRIIEKEYPLLYNSTDLYKDVQKYKLATIKELNDILNKLYVTAYISNPNTESRHLPFSFTEAESDKDGNKLTEILRALKGVPLYKPYIDYIKASNEYVVLSGRSFNDKHVDNHHAIIPTVNAPIVHNLTPQEFDVYDLVVRRFLTMFMGNQIENAVVINGYVDANNHFKYENTKVIKPGWQVLYETEEDIYDLLKVSEAPKSVVDFTVGEYVQFQKESIVIQPGSSRGKSRYTIAALIDMMGNCGKIIKDDKKKVRLRHLSIGLPGDRNLIINDLISKNLIEVIDGKVYMTAKGKEIMEKSPRGLLSLQLLETFNNKIKSIEQGHDSMYSVLREHTSYITKIILDKHNAKNPYKMVDYASLVRNNECRFCDGGLADKGDFIGCKKYPTCKMSIPKEKNQHILTEKDIEQLLKNGITDLITDFTFSKGPVRGCKAKLQFNLKRKVELVFEQNKKDLDS